MYNVFIAFKYMHTFFKWCGGGGGWARLLRTATPQEIIYDSNLIKIHAGLFQRTHKIYKLF